MEIGRISGSQGEEGKGDIHLEMAICSSNRMMVATGS